MVTKLVAGELLSSVIGEISRALTGEWETTLNCALSLANIIGKGIEGSKSHIIVLWKMVLQIL